MPHVVREVTGAVRGTGPSSQLNQSINQGRVFRSGLMIAASALAIMVATPDEVMAACVPGAPVAGNTVNCAPGVYGPLSWAVDDLTVVVGSGVSASTISGGASNGITMTGGAGDLDLSVLHAGSAVTSTGNNGVVVIGSATAVDVSINSEGSIAAPNWGIYARNFGTGAIDITTVAVSSTNFSAIDAVVNGAGTDLSVTSTGLVSGRTGVGARNYGSGSTTVAVADATATLFDGINARNTGADLSVSATGTISAARYGVVASNFGSGSLSVDLASVSGTSRNAVYARNHSGTGLTVAITGAASGGRYGIFADNDGSGATSVTAAAVTGGSRDGIFARGDGTTLSVVATGAVSGATEGIDARNYGSGALSVSATDVTGTAGFGVRAYGDASTTSIDITTSGAVTGGTDGIYTRNLGSGSTTISANSVTGSGYGIHAYGGTSTTDLVVATTGAVVGGTWDGIYAYNFGTGTTTVSASGPVTGGDRGISVQNRASGTDIIIGSTGTVTGGRLGTASINWGTGVLDIDVVNSYGTISFGVVAWNEGTDLSITSTGTVGGGQDGILARNNGSGTTTLSVVDVTGTTGNGIRAINYASATNMDITATGTVAGGTHGIYARNLGTGETYVRAADVTGTSGTGVLVHGSGSYGTYVASHPLLDAYGNPVLEITGVTNTLVYGTSPILDANGDPVLDEFGDPIFPLIDIITTTTYGAPIIVPAYTTYAGVTVMTSGTVAGGANGIHATNTGLGSLSIGAEGPVTGTAGFGVFASNSGMSVDIGISAAATVSGGTTGIYANNQGTGATTVISADVTGGSARGIDARAGFAATDMTIVASGTVSGATDGIFAHNQGTGGTLVSGGVVTGTTGHGIRAYNFVSGTNVIVSASDTVTGGASGIVVSNLGTGLTTVAAMDVVGTDGRGIYAYGAATAGAMSIVALGSITGATDGIWACNRGDGSFIQTHGTVTGTTGDGIYACSVIDANAYVYGGVNGIHVNHMHPDAVSITATDVTGGAGTGILVYNPGIGTDVSIITSGTVLGGADGIEVRNSGTGYTRVSVLDVTGTAGRGIDIHTHGTNTTIASTGTVAGLLDGIYARSFGTGSIDITAATVTASSYAAVFAYSTGAGTDVDITTSGVITGVSFGIYASNLGSGEVNITTADDVTASSGTGVFSVNVGTSTTIDTAGLVYGSLDGIDARNYGSGALSIEAVDTTGATGQGIDALNTGTDLAIESNGTATGGLHGIFARNYGSGSTIIDAVTVTSATGTGIGTRSTGTYQTLSVTGAVYGGVHGIYAHNTGSGALSVSTSGTVTGSVGHGIFGFNTGTDLSIVASDTVSGGDYGIVARNYGSGSLTVSSAAVSGGVGNGIDAINTGSSLSVTSTGTVYGGTNGIFSRNYGSGPVTVNTMDVTGGTGNGIQVYNSGSGGEVSINVLGAITGGFVGIATRNYGTDTDIVATSSVYGGVTGIHSINGGSGSLDINVDAVTGAGGTGIFAFASGTDASITATGTVYGGTDGVYVRNYGSGSTTVEVVDVTGASNFGVYVRNQASATDLSITATGSVYGRTYGVVGRNYGSGSNIISVYDVTSSTKSGIHATNRGTSLTVTATGTVSGGGMGIFARNFGSDAISIDAVDVTGGYNFGIYAENFAGYGTNLSITATGTVYGATDGIRAYNFGSGDTTINAVDVTGGSGAGINATAAASSGLLSVITTGTVYGGTDGIRACGIGSGGSYVHAYGTVTGGTGTGIYACSTIIAEMDVYGGTHGIHVNHVGTDGVNITSNGAVTGQTGIGIYVENSVAGTYVDIDANGYVYGGVDGILVSNGGTGSTTVSAIDVTGASGRGIAAYGSAATTDLSVTATGYVFGSGYGIAAIGKGSGAVVVNAVDVTSATSFGIYGETHGTGLTITSTGTVSGGVAGVHTLNFGSGATTINVVDVYGTNPGASTGISAANGGAATDIIITSTGVVSGLWYGMLVNNTGTGETTIDAVDVYGGAPKAGINVHGWGTDLSITTLGTVSGGRGIYSHNPGTGTTAISVVDVYGTVSQGIFARDAATSMGMTITATGTVSGYSTGIDARHYGTGATTITAVDVTGGTGRGIYAYGAATTSNMTVTTTGTILGATDGIWACNNGSGSTLVHTYGTVTGTSGDGIYACSTIIAEAAVFGGTNGIVSIHNHTDGISITATDVTGLTGVGILAHNSASGTDVTITSTGAVWGGTTGIYAYNAGSGGVSITPTGSVYGSSYGVFTVSASGAVINVGSGVTIDGSTAAIVTDGIGGADADDTVNTGGIILGNILMLGGTDVLNFTGGSITGLVAMGDEDDTVNWSAGTLTGQMLGGADYDTLNVSLAGGGAWIATGTGADAFDEFEELNFLTGGWLVNGTDQVGYDLITFNAGANSLSGDLVVGSLGNMSASTLITGDGSSVTGNVTNHGGFLVGGAAAGATTINGNFTQTGSGTFYADVIVPGSTDLLTVTGGVSLAGDLVVNQQIIPFMGTTTIIDGGTGLAGTFDNVSGIIPGGILFSQAIEYDAANFDVNLVSDVGSAHDIEGMSENHGNVINGLLAPLNNPGSTDPDFLTLAFAIATMRSGNDLNAAAAELYPGVVDASLVMADDAQRRFNRQMQNEAADLSMPTYFRAALNHGVNVWGSFGFARNENKEGGNEYVSFEGNARDLRAGINGFDVRGITLGAALGHTRSTVTTIGNGTDTADISTFLLGGHMNVPLNREGNGLNAHMDGSLSWAGTNGEITRRVVIADPDVNETNMVDETFESDYDSSAVELDLRFTLDGLNGNVWPIRPLAILGGRSIGQDMIEERGDGLTALRVEESDQSHAFVGLGAEFSHMWNENHRLMLRTTGIEYLGDGQNSHTSEFQSATPGLTTFETVGDPVNSVLLFEGGYGYIIGDTFDVGIDGFMELGDRDNLGGSFRVSTSF